MKLDHLRIAEARIEIELRALPEPTGFRALGQADRRRRDDPAASVGARPEFGPAELEQRLLRRLQAGPCDDPVEVLRDPPGQLAQLEVRAAGRQRLGRVVPRGLAQGNSRTDHYLIVSTILASTTLEHRDVP